LHSVTLIAGDGIGPEVTRSACHRACRRRSDGVPESCRRTAGRAWIRDAACIWVQSRIPARYQMPLGAPAWFPEV